ncbi:MAG: GMC family oxidoreductase N-terminal domain-containing protein [Streptosporangiaceae bacterium]|nr:GMC family oxidoreductase N-terminal domain-containing protein [Streptosporangiaceae bacterium]
MTAGLDALDGWWDDVIVGAGSSGAVLASRLSEQPGRRVLLVEAGSAQAAGAHAPPSPLGRPVLTGANWDYEASLGTDADGDRRYPYPVGKAVGGSSAVNGAIALRGLPADFEEWSAAGGPDWTWDRVLPYFVRIEADADIIGQGHGRGGPIPIRRPARSRLGAVPQAFVTACHAAGLPDLYDLNGSPGPGVGPVPSNSAGGRRVSTADAYLTPACDRPNLVLRERCHVLRVLVERGRAVGLEGVVDGRRSCRIRAGQVTLSAGAINTPAILQRSGIGSAGQLRSVGIDPVADVPGVGENLSDHPAVTIWGVPATASWTADCPLHQVMARALASNGRLDLGVFLATNVAGADIPVIGRALGAETVMSVSAVLLAPASRGSVRLRDSSPQAKPAVTLGLASERADIDELMEATRLAWSIVRRTPLAGLVGRIVIWTDRMVSDSALLKTAIARFACPLWHAAGTARMGPVTDPMAVVDARCRVHSVPGLHVVDASVMPSVLRATPNLSCIMLAERVAEWMA